MSQANTKEGDILVLAAEDLLMADVLLCACDFEVLGNHRLGVRHPSKKEDLPLYLLLFGGRRGVDVTVRPMARHRSCRIRVEGNGAPGTRLYALLNGSGHVTPLDPRGPLVGIAEEPFSNGDLVRVRPI